MSRWSGFDDTAIAATIWPPLTTVRWPIRAMARSAARKLIHPEAAATEQSLFLTEFVPRASVSAAEKALDYADHL